MTHENPRLVVDGVKDQFSVELIANLRKICDALEPGTIDAVLYGGNTSSDEKVDQYTDSINTLTDICKSELGFVPAVAMGPNAPIKRGFLHVYLDTQNRRLYMSRPEQKAGKERNVLGFTKRSPENPYHNFNNATNHSFSPTDLEKEKKKWQMWDN
jgi:hypothetical protein